LQPLAPQSDARPQVCSYAAIPARWFPLGERTLATSAAVQSNYAGWCVGALLFPYSVHRRRGRSRKPYASPCFELHRKFPLARMPVGSSRA
jgi:hypothetical protein